MDETCRYGNLDISIGLTPSIPRAFNTNISYDESLIKTGIIDVKISNNKSTILVWSTGVAAVIQPPYAYYHAAYPVF